MQECNAQSVVVLVLVLSIPDRGCVLRYETSVTGMFFGCCLFSECRNRGRMHASSRSLAQFSCGREKRLSHSNRCKSMKMIPNS